MKIAVTGAAGLVGSHLVDYLSKNGAYSVTAIVRSLASIEQFKSAWQKQNIKVVEANVLNLSQLEDAFQGADIVVHSAAVVDPFGDRAQIFSVNVDGTKNALLAARKVKAEQFIYVSSLSVITGNKDQYGSSEHSPYEPCGEAYADSKIEAELFVRQEAEASQTPAITVVRPGFIYGPRERTWMPRLIDSIAKGKAMLIDGGTKETNVIYVGNLCFAIENIFNNKKAFGQVYNLTDGPGITKKQLFDALSDGLSLPRVTKVVPGFLAKGFCQIVSTLAPVLSVDTQRNLARYSKAAFRLAGLNQGYSIARAEQDLNYKSRTAFADGMAETLSYIRSEKGEKKQLEAAI
jgi:nucleoside-diphosphate-sugar epimerase